MSNLSPTDGATGKKRTIAVVVPSFEDVGGVPTVAEFILRAIARHPGYEAQVVSLATSSSDACSLLATNPATWWKGATTRQGRAHDQDFVHVGARFGEFEFQRLAARAPLSAALRRCDLIQVVAGVPAWAHPVLGLGKPVVLQVATLTAVERRKRDRMGGGFKRMWRNAMTRIVSGMDETALTRVDAVMVENPWMYDHVTRSTSSLKTIVRYAPPGVDTALFHPRETPAAPEPYILSVGRFSDPRKNVLLLLEAYALLAHSLASAPRLVLAGTGDPGERFWSQAAKLGVRDRIAFHLMPTSDEVAVLFRSATCFALASDEEGFGIVVAEALASGLPVVSTRSGGPEGIISDGVDGYLVARDDAAQMADRLERLLRDPVGAAAMGKMGRAKVEKRFEDRVAGNVYLDVYRELLSRQC